MNDTLKETFEKDYTELPVMAMRDSVIFPSMTAEIPVGRAESKAALKAAAEQHNGRLILLIQNDPEKEELALEDMAGTGTLVTITDSIEQPDGSLLVKVEATDRVQIDSLALEGGYLRAQNTIREYSDNPQELAATYKLAKEALIKVATTEGSLDKQVVQSIQDSGLEDLNQIIALMVSNIDALKVADRQKLLETDSAASVLETLYSHFSSKQSVALLEKKIKTRVKSSMEKTQREYYLKEQMKAIQEELGEGEEAAADELDELAKHFEDESIPEAVREKAQKEIKKLKQMSPMQAEYNVLRTYLDVLRDVPWGVKSETNDNPIEARDILDHDHYGLNDVKENVAKYLAVQKRLKDKGLLDQGNSKIMCLIGPPGVGKTSIAKSLSKATGREYVRMALGGVRDEAELRGHRRTYIGAKPGKIVSHLIKAKTMNPLFVLDEIDKMGSDQRGDPASAMLEVLDPEQNSSFEDHYLDLEMDLSDVMFYCTANEFARIPEPLQDRMEKIFLGSYMPEEKLEIARQHLVRKQMKATGLDEDEFSITEDALKKIIANYTREAGVRELQRLIGTVCQEVVVKLAETGETSMNVTEDMIADILGPEQFSGHQKKAEDKVGIVAGLAYTAVGGKPLFIETVQFPSKNDIVKMTGSLKDVMKESIDYAVSYLKANAKDLGLKEDAFNGKTIHVHCPAGAVPKDGPSAGAAMLTAIFSQVSGQKISRDVAMTGEINLSGEVTAIGGLKEKLTGAAAAGFTKVLIPEENVKDLHDVPEKVKAALTIVPVSNVNQVLDHTIVGRKPAIMTLGS
ncbi:MAG: endopeptidase La [Pseudomonadota bacterium]|nr:endopeptidase La [Pseudomonadota bacterium]